MFRVFRERPKIVDSLELLSADSHIFRTYMAEYNANGLDRGEQGSRSDMTLYLLCKHGCMRFPSGSPTVPHGESSLIKVIASPKNEEETFVASRAETRNGSGSSEGSGSLHPCWNQILELDMRGKGGQNFNGLHIDLIQEWGELKSKEQWVCGSATLGVPTDAQSVYDGWIPLKNGYGGTNGKITLSCSFDRNYIEALRMGLSPVTPSGRMKVTKNIAELNADKTVFKLDMLRLDMGGDPCHPNQPTNHKDISAASRKRPSFRDFPASCGSQSVSDTRQDEDKGVASDNANLSNSLLS